MVYERAKRTQTHCLRRPATLKSDTIRCCFIAIIRLEAIATGVEALVTRVEAIASRLEGHV